MPFEHAKVFWKIFKILFKVLSACYAQKDPFLIFESYLSLAKDFFIKMFLKASQDLLIKLSKYLNLLLRLFEFHTCGCKSIPGLFELKLEFRDKSSSTRRNCLAIMIAICQFVVKELGHKLAGFNKNRTGSHCKV